MTIKQYREKLSKNCWDWSLADFAQRSGLNPATAHTRELFLAMRDLSTAMNRFDDKNLSLIFGEESK